MCTKSITLVLLYTSDVPMLGCLICLAPTSNDWRYYGSTIVQRLYHCNSHETGCFTNTSAEDTLAMSEFWGIFRHREKVQAI